MYYTMFALQENNVHWQSWMREHVTCCALLRGLRNYLVPCLTRLLVYFSSHKLKGMAVWATNHYTWEQCDCPCAYDSPLHSCDLTLVLHSQLLGMSCLLFSNPCIVVVWLLRWITSTLLVYIHDCVRACTMCITRCVGVCYPCIYAKLRVGLCVSKEGSSLSLSLFTVGMQERVWEHLVLTTANYHQLAPAGILRL